MSVDSHGKSGPVVGVWVGARECTECDGAVSSSCPALGQGRHLPGVLHSSLLCRGSISSSRTDCQNTAFGGTSLLRVVTGPTPHPSLLLSLFVTCLRSSLPVLFIPSSLCWFLES